MLTEEAFNRHPRPQAPYVPTHGALVLQKTQTAKKPGGERLKHSALKVDIPAENSRKRHLPSPSPIAPTKIINLTKSPPTSPPPVHLPLSKAVRRTSPIRAQHDASAPSTHRTCTSHLAEPLLHTQDGLPWERLRRLGAIMQGASELFVCVEQDEPRRMTMVKPLSRRSGGLEEARQLRKLSHPNIIQILEVFLHSDEVYIELEYCRFTLEEIVDVHIRLKEPHLRLITHSVFAAIRHISAHRIIHGNISLQTIRVCGQSMVIKLTDFGHVTYFEETMPNSDLEQLGLVLLQCMDGQSAGKHTDVEYVRQQRATYKVFGLSQPELWSGAKQLMDFLDELFSQSKSATSKIEKPHPYIREDVSSPSLLPYLELVTLESFVLWTEA